MSPIEAVTNQPYQSFTLQSDDGQLISIELKFMPRINGWYIKRLEFNDFILTNIRVVNSINFLRQYRNMIPFGLGCISEQKKEPMFINDFLTGASTLYYLSASECKEYEEYLIESKV